MGRNLDSASITIKTRLTALLIPCLIGGYLVITSTVNVFPDIPVYDVKRVFQYVLLPVVFLLTLSSSSVRLAFADQVSNVPKLVGLGIVLFLLLGITSAVVNSESHRGLLYSLVDVSTFGLLMVLAITVAACREQAGQNFDRMVISFLTVMALAVGFQELMGFWAVRSVGGVYNFDLALIHFSFPRMYNHLQTWTIPILAALPFVFSRNRLAAVICIIALGLHWYILLVTGARGSIVSLLTAFMIVSFFSPIARKAIIRWQFAGFLLGIMLYAGFYAISAMDKDRLLPGSQSATASEQSAEEFNPAIVNSKEQTRLNSFYDRSVGRPMLHTSGRTGLWKSAIGHTKENPFLGIGPMNFDCKGPKGRLGSPHNFAFQILSEWGIPALIILVSLGFFMLWFLFQGLKSSGDEESGVQALKILLITSILAACVHLMVSSLLLTPASQVAAALIGGWFLGISAQLQQKPNARLAMGLLCSAALCGLMLLPFGYHEMVEMPVYREQLPAVEQGRPRLWQLGKTCSNKIELQ